ncbi:GerMN domain-containing protein [Deferribacter autotrophicus]|uniref:GerMN domain-containing protein n=1 Tax=Deferribacter autotrophicus TaxID=500465 RepID=A0A5A8F6G2_9BACT|nr:GerMN domain-containing protein [Deferribacter autotrophicus]KAA0258399.1 GerMN domain-containing protein [Deferribacter autotrophicus]
MKRFLYLIIGFLVILFFLFSIRIYDAYFIDIESNKLIPKKVVVINPFYQKNVYAFLLLNKLKVEKGDHTISAVGEFVKFQDVNIKNGFCKIRLSFLKGFQNGSNSEYLFLKSLLKTLKSFDSNIKVFKIDVVNSEAFTQIDYNCAMTLENDEIKIIEGSCDEK